MPTGMVTFVLATIYWQHLSIYAISKLSLTWFWLHFKGKFLGQSLTGNICPGNICTYQQPLIFHLTTNLILIEVWHWRPKSCHWSRHGMLRKRHEHAHGINLEDCRRICGSPRKSVDLIEEMWRKCSIWVTMCIVTVENLR